MRKRYRKNTKKISTKGMTLHSLKNKKQLKN